MAQNNQRTQDELNKPELNYYIAFGIDPAERDKTKIDTKIKKYLSSTKGDITSRRLIELRTDILEIMVNDAVFDGAKYVPNSGGRAKESALAKSFKLSATVKLVEILCQTRKTLLKSELDNIYQKASMPIAFFSEKEFYAAIDYLMKMGVRIIDNVDARIPFDDYIKTEKQLESLDKADLYDFLDISRSAPESEIKSANEAAFKQSSKLSELKRRQAYSALCGIVNNVLLSGVSSKANYDMYLLLKEKVWGEFQKRKEFAIMELTMDEYERYVQTVINLAKVSVVEAEQLIAIGCKYFRFNVVGKTDDNNLEECPYADCGKLYIKGAKSCPHCGKPLVSVCWNCGEQTRITKDDRGCAKCGATMRGHGLFNKACGNLDKLLNNPSAEIAELQTALLQVKNVVPRHERFAAATVTKKVKEYEGLLAARIRQEETIGVKYKEEVKNIRELIGLRNFQTALAKAKSLQVKYASYNTGNSRKLVEDISLKMRDAQKYVNEAKKYIQINNKAAAIASAAKALDICADFNDARQIMQKYPPLPVSNLRVSVDKGKVRLEWNDDSKQEYVFYTVIKKIGVAPGAPDDGSVVDSGLSVKFCEDESAVSATPYYYAVFAERYGVTSTVCVSDKQIVLFADVENMRQEVVDGGVKVTWSAPQNVKAVEVWRKSGAIAPARPGDGTQINSELKGFSDERCTEESTYLVVCRYEMNGKKMYSSGISALFKPYEKIYPLENVDVQSIGNGRYKFSCKSDYAGKVRLFYSEQEVQIDFGVPQKFIDFNKLCKGLQAINAIVNADGEAEFILPQGKIYRVYPINSTEQLFIVSKPTIINNIEGLTDVKTTAEEGTVHISGNLHNDAKKIIVKVSNEKHIDKIDLPGERFEYAVEAVRKSKSFDVKIKANAISYLSIFVEFKTGNIVTYSRPVFIDPIDYREAVTVLYSISYAVSSVKSFKLTVAFEADEEITLPDMLLIQGYPRPMNKTAGTLCERLENIKLKKKLFSQKCTAKTTVSVPPTAQNTKFALFLNEQGGRVKIKEVKTL